jgi:hypothetical protein
MHANFGGGLSPPDRPVGVPFGRSGRGSLLTWPKEASFHVNGFGTF